MVSRSQEHLTREGRTTASGEGIKVITYPSFTGNMVQGQTLTAVMPVAQGVVGTIRQWMRGNTPIASASAATYVLQAGDVGFNIALRVTLTKTGFPSTVIYSKSRGPVTAS